MVDNYEEYKLVKKTAKKKTTTKEQLQKLRVRCLKSFTQDYYGRKEGKEYIDYPRLGKEAQRLGNCEVD